MKSKINVIILAIGLFFLILPLGIFGQDPEPTSNPFAKLKVFSVLSAPPQVIPEKRT